MWFITAYHNKGDMKIHQTCNADFKRLSTSHVGLKLNRINSC